MSKSNDIYWSKYTHYMFGKETTKKVLFLLLVQKYTNLPKDIFVYILIPKIIGILIVKDCRFTVNTVLSPGEIELVVKSITSITHFTYDPTKNEGWFRCKTQTESDKFLATETYTGFIENKSIPINIGRSATQKWQLNGKMNK